MHPFQLKTLEANKEVAAAAEKLERERQKKLEKDIAAEAKIREAASKVDDLMAKQAQQQQRCYEAVNAQGSLYYQSLQIFVNVN